MFLENSAAYERISQRVKYSCCHKCLIMVVLSVTGTVWYGAILWFLALLLISMVERSNYCRSFLKATSTQNFSSGFHFWPLHKLLLLLVVLFSASGTKAQHLGFFLFIHVSFPSLVNIYIILNYSISDSFWHEQHSCLVILQRACLSCSSQGLPLPSEQALRAALGMPCCPSPCLGTPPALLGEGTEWRLCVKSNPLFLPGKFVSKNTSRSWEKSSLLHFGCKH